MSLPFNVQHMQGRYGVDDPMADDPGLFHLSRTERLWAFGGCFVVGLALSIIGSALVFTGSVAAFAVCYSLGNTISLLGTCFLVGFKKHFKMALAPVRLTAFLVYIVFLALTFVSAFAFDIAALCIVFAILQYCALFWYSASYIPYGRKIIKSTCGTFAKAI
ncbi:hypothetical protein IWQ56_000962 [Coemansia nantahalensis]|uniref:Uncharacterized protein n=2 Tax=Coemansia TaxID=4863 RepID=A0ACC1LGX1_9FUNG|nr:hypothetical protein IWQ56_000962 [Coemansia nantahalensis]KAJ2775573.1 hypothetical protein IWQ57_000363 [Coemansia nantahalensis]KAJ2808222.1 hypothetical protein H4R21_000147 [Coemansia helicoidea]